MSQWSISNAARRREQFWRTKPPDPTQQHAKAGVPYYRPGQSRVLMPDDFMPLGPHAGKHLRAVPAAYLAWVNAQPWSAAWPHWQPVADFLTRFPLPPHDPVHAEMYVTALRHDHAELYCLPGHNDYLHTFAEGALRLDRRHFWNNPRQVEWPHYRLTARLHDAALGHGAVLVDASTRLAHIRIWRSKLSFQRVHEGTDATKPSACDCTKHAYSKVEAETALNHRLNGRKHHRNTRPEFLRIYECPLCGFWHLTSKPLR
jgi:hypothetical protein